MASDADALQQAATVVRQGGVIAYPTEAVYGLGCDPRDEKAVLRLLQIKQRDVAQGLILIGQSLDDFSAFIQPLKDDIRDKLQASWPGPVSWLVPVSPGCPKWLCGEHETLAIRVTAHQQTRALCATAQMPLVSTSANRSGQAPATTAAEVQQQLGDDVDYILAGATDGQERPCQIRDSESEKIIRR
jgi:L-threonylcarbamoyladenylate synthase